MRNGNHARLKGCLAGLTGGAAGTFAMGLYMKGMQKIRKEKSHLSQEKSGGSAKEHDVSLVGRQHLQGENAAVAVGRILYEKIRHREPDEQTRNKLGSVVHWGYGIKMGGAYGLIRGRKPKLDLLGGLAYGAALWAIGDEMAVPLLGLAEGPKAYPKSLHAETFGAHLVYGVATAAATQLLERVI
jgi:hypothetical protein